MRKVFIDCGAWEGLSAKFFKENHPYSKDFEIFSFECNPEALSKLTDIDDINIIDKAVWITDDTIDFYLSTKNAKEGSTLFKEKKTGAIDKEHPIRVKCINFSKWITDNFNKDDFIIVKMNVEGAEYQIIRTMLKEGSLDYINKLYIQWHWKKIKYPEKKHKSLLSKIKNSNIELYPWPLDHDKNGEITGTWSKDFLRTL